MCGWFSVASTRASRSKRASRSGSERKTSATTLMATSRPSFVSRARYTSPIPPAPRTRKNLVRTDLPADERRPLLIQPGRPPPLRRSAPRETAPPSARAPAAPPPRCRSASSSPHAAATNAARSCTSRSSAASHSRRHAVGARGLSSLFSFELTKQPEFRQSPVAFDGVGRNMEHLGRLLHAQASEEPQFDDTALPGVSLLQSL